jgi:hypothetical protein
MSSQTSEVVTHDSQREQSPWKTLVLIWRDQYPPEAPSPKSFTPVVKLVVTPVLIARRLSPNTLLRNRGASAIDVMVMAWAALTTLVLLLPALRGSVLPSWFALALAYFRLVDTGTQKLMEVLVHSLRPPLHASIQRTLLLSAINLYEIIASFAIIYLVGGGVEQAGKSLSTASAAFYFSTVTALTVGYGDYAPVTDQARRIVVGEIALVALFIVAWFPVAVSLLFQGRSTPGAPGASQSNTR